MPARFDRLTRPAIRSLAVGDKITEHGITAHKLPNGAVRYSINIMADGERIHRVVGSDKDGVGREQAERLIEKLRTEAREGRLDLPKGRKLHRSFAEAQKEYLARMKVDGKNIGPKTRHLRQHLTPYFGSKRIDQITEFLLKSYRKDRRKQGAKDSTINREIATMSHLLRTAALEWKWFKADRLPKFPKVEEKAKRIDILSNEQADALQKAAMADTDQRLWLFVAFGLGAAMRHREILAARYDQIDFDNRRLFIPDAKAGQREQPLTPALVEALKRQREMEKDKDGWIFPSLIPKQSKKGHRTNMARPFERAVKAAKLDPKKVTPHTMRHTAITRLVKAGVDLPTIQRISGHKTLAMVLKYTHIHGNHIDNAMNALEGSFAGTITPELHTGAQVVPISRAGNAA